ncbi:hypothetical protein HMPREF9453_01000 [Dialister succinatiphilus YIT 11850]|uniref:Uncharacterized protein n=1 Tax=Dialister succinatiphilus YIT 11850 TaxID=742743 RepID=H1D062_9FIRM|nr:hypothetical protein HMPREF9453_01000 [Dialister succinatiphilus YIT 11850]
MPSLASGKPWVFVKNRREAVFPKVDTPYGQAPMGLEGSGAFGAVGIGAWTWAVLSGIPEGACACGAEGHMASIGPPALGAKGCVERLRPTGKTTHYDLCVAGAPASSAVTDSLDFQVADAPLQIQFA